MSQHQRKSPGAPSSTAHLSSAKPAKAAYAHSLPDRPESDWEPLADHLAGVAKRARESASKFNAAAWGELAGRWHDLGKYSLEFQSYLKSENGLEAHLEQYIGRVDHSTAGAQHAAACLGAAGRILAYCIAGHHAGLADATADTSTAALSERLTKEIPDYTSAPVDLLTKPDLPDPSLTLTHGDQQRAAFQLAFFTRMMFSCLYDADFLATEADFDADIHAPLESRSSTVLRLAARTHRRSRSRRCDSQRKPHSPTINVIVHPNPELGLTRREGDRIAHDEKIRPTLRHIQITAIRNQPHVDIRRKNTHETTSIPEVNNRNP